MSDDIETKTGSPEEATAEAESGYGDIVTKGDINTPEDVNEGETEEPKVEAEPLDPDAIEIELEGKKYKGKTSEVLEQVVNRHKEALKGFTQETQKSSEFRKSVEGAFGQIPEPQMLNALGKIYQESNTNPKVAEVLNSILDGKLDEYMSPAQPEGQKDAYTQGLEKKISGLENQLRQFMGSIESREQEKIKAEADRVWKGWVAEKQKDGSEINEEIESTMNPIIMALDKQHPEWDDTKILNESYRRAMLILDPDKVEKETAGKVLTQADKVKKGNPPKITPKGAEKSDGEKSYAELLAG